MAFNNITAFGDEFFDNLYRVIEANERANGVANPNQPQVGPRIVTDEELDADDPLFPVRSTRPAFNLDHIPYRVIQHGAEQVGSLVLMTSMTAEGAERFVEKIANHGRFIMFTKAGMFMALGKRMRDVLQMEQIYNWLGFTWFEMSLLARDIANRTESAAVAHYSFTDLHGQDSGRVQSLLSQAAEQAHLAMEAIGIEDLNVFWTHLVKLHEKSVAIERQMQQIVKGVAHAASLDDIVDDRAAQQHEEDNEDDLSRVWRVYYQQAHLETGLRRFEVENEVPVSDLVLDVLDKFRLEDGPVDAVVKSMMERMPNIHRNPMQDLRSLPQTWLRDYVVMEQFEVVIPTFAPDGREANAVQ